jgi:small subunit ribosomal protein S17
MSEQIEEIEAADQQRELLGRVVSDKMDKTVTVMVERRVKHPLYKKYIRRSSKLHAHDETNDCREGDTVTIEQCRPLSKSKNWRVTNVVNRAG